MPKTMTGEGGRRTPALRFQLSSVRLSLMSSRRGAGADRLVLRQPIFFRFRRAVFIGAAVDHRLSLEITMGRRRRRSPLQGIRLPGIAFGFLPGEQTPEEVVQEEDLRSAENQSADGNVHVPMLHRLDKFILQR